MARHRKEIKGYFGDLVLAQTPGRSYYGLGFKRAVFGRRVRAKAVFDIVLDASIGIIGMLTAIDTCLIIVCRFALIVIGRRTIFCGGWVFFGASCERADARKSTDDADDTADNFGDVLHSLT